MSPRSIAEMIRREVPLLSVDTPVGVAVAMLLETGFPALPVVHDNQRLAGIFGERELITALFPGYVGSLGHVGFVPKSVEAAIQKRQGCRDDPVSRHMHTEHIDVPADFADIQLAEIFIHHRVLIIPVTDDARVCGIVTRSDFFAALAERLLPDH
jgi:CBS domain-containing protein